MREILFRGKRCDNGEWVQGFYVRADHHWHKNGIHKDWIALGASANGGWFALHNKYAVKTETVGQFTGLTDKNGKKIFEGDILKERDVVHNGEIQIKGIAHEVVMRKGCWCVIPANDIEGWDFLSSNAKLCEIIGNIHDNPEMIKHEP